MNTAKINIFFPIAALGFLLNLFFKYKEGNEFSIYDPIVAISWTITAAEASILYNVFRKAFKRESTMWFLCFITFLPSFATVFIPLIRQDGYSAGYSFYIACFTALHLLNCVIFLFLMTKSKSLEELGELGTHQQTGGNTTSEPQRRAENKNLDVVINSLISRANNAQKLSSISLIFIVFIVLIGGGASIGATALDELKRVHEIESERNKLLDLNEQFSQLIKNSQKPGLDLSNLPIIIQIREKYGKEPNYETILRNIEKRGKDITTGWQDLAMRISIAALSLFLVQVFFHIYKFNQQQNSYLLAKSETLRLFRDTQEKDMEKMRDVILAKMEASPKFGKTPQNALEIALELINRVKNSQ